VTKADAEHGVSYGHLHAVDPTESDLETRLVERLRERDERAFNELVRTYELRVFRLVFRMLGRRDEAEDLVQEVFVQVFKAIDSFRGESKVSTWIYRIAVNLCKNRTKYLSRRYASAQDELELQYEPSTLQQARGVTSGETAGPDQVLQGHQLERIMKRSIQELDADFREVLILRDIEDLPYEEIVEITGLPEGTVKSRIHRARAMLKQRIERHLGEKIE
jgi:RNA polymerase sigma-70 factor, ECF subfamily